MTDEIGFLAAALCATAGLVFLSRANWWPAQIIWAAGIVSNIGWMIWRLGRMVQ